MMTPTSASAEKRPRLRVLLQPLQRPGEAKRRRVEEEPAQGHGTGAYACGRREYGRRSPSKQCDELAVCLSVQPAGVCVCVWFDIEVTLFQLVRTPLSPPTGQPKA